jgi:hypothetical protein
MLGQALSPALVPSRPDRSGYALGGKLLKDLGYEKVFSLGGFKDWADSGGAVAKV